MYVSESGHSAKLSLDVAEFIRNTRNAKDAADGMANAVVQLADEFPDLQKRVDAAGRALAGSGRDAKGATKDVKAYATGFDELVKSMQAAKKAQGDLAQKDAVGAVATGKFTPSTGTGMGAARASSDADINKLIATDNAMTANAVSNARKVRKERDDAAAAEKKNLSDRDQAIHINAQKDAAALEKAGQARLKSNAAIYAATEAQRQNTGSLISARYALYDVSTTAGIASVALLGASALTVKVGADFESAFTGVERTSTGTVQEIEGLRDALVDLSTQVPLTFDQLSSIAALGNQLGVASQDIEGFTGTVARFSAVTGLTAEATAQAFGRISNIIGIPISEAENLGSAITLVGRNSASTEQEIIGLTERLGATATRAGFTADEVVGLAGALGSLGVAPERAQGVFETYFNTLNESVAEGGKKLEYFAQITGLSTDAINEMVRSGDGFEVFQSFLSGLQGADTVELTTALGELGLTGLRANEVIGRISGSLPLLKSAFADASQGYSEGTELGRQYALIADDLNSKFKMLVSSVNALIAEMSGGSIEGIAGLITVLTDVVNKAREFADNKIVQNIARFALVFSVVAGAVLGLVSMLALATASTFALRTAQVELGKMGAAGGIRGLIQAMFGIKAGADGAATSTFRLAGALKAVGIATIIGAIFQVLAMVIFDFGGSMKSAAKGLQWLVGGMNNAIGSITRFLGGIAEGIPLLHGFIGVLGRVLQISSKGVADKFSKWADAIPVTEMADMSDATADLWAGMGDLTGGTEDYTGALEDTGGALDSVAAKVVTLKDYATDLAGVIGRAFEIRFAGGQGVDAITSQWSTISQASDDAAKSIRDFQQSIRELNADQQQLGADRKVLEYFKAVADRYGDGLASADLSARLAENAAEQSKKQNELADANKGLTAAQAANSKVLTGNSDAAIANRAQILGLVTSYQDYIAKLAASGMSQSDLMATSARLKQEFIQQATQAGYSRGEIDLYSLAFDDMRTAIDNVPRNITVDANADPALQALAEFTAAAAAAVAAGVNIPIRSTYDPAGDQAAADGAAKRARGAKIEALYNKAIKSGSDNVAARYLEQLNSGNYAEGGYTGDGGMYQPAGVVHKGEYVFSKAATSSLGVNNLAKLHSMGKGKRGYSGGGMVGGGSGSGSFGGPVDLSAGSIMQIAQAVSQINVNLYTDDRRIAESSNRGTMLLASGGTN